MELNLFSSEILNYDFLKKYEQRYPNWGFNGLGYFVYKRTYSRLKPNGISEEWPETIARCINGAQKIGARYTKEEAQRLFDYFFNFKCLYAGRMLWQLGTPLVDKLFANSLINCFFTNIAEVDDFCFLFENLMLGGGIGFSVRREHIHELPKVKSNVIIQHQQSKDADFIVPDSREGWVALLRLVLNSFLVTGKSLTYSTVLVRGYGEPIKTFGGFASGPNILTDGIAKICTILKNRELKKLRSIDVLDICNIIGSIVVAGNVRRSAQLSLGDADDFLFLKAKRWDDGNIPNWRAMSNNTICADNFDYISNMTWDGYNGNGEPYGFFNLSLAQNYGRAGEKALDLEVSGLNPCGEIGLEHRGVCNLSELFLNNILSKEELIDCAKLLYKAQKAITSLHYLHESTEKIVHKNRRIGIGIGAVCQSLDKLSWLHECYNELRKFDKEWSQKQGISESIKLTTVKPSGTISLLAGATPGIHPAFAQYYFRTVRIRSDDPLLEFYRESNHRIEFLKRFDQTIDHSTCIIYFPCKADDKSIVAKNMSALKQLDLLKNIQTIWADNAVSCTVYYRKEELNDIKDWLKKHYQNHVKSVSFLLHANHGFEQAPYIEISQAEYEESIKKINKNKKSFSNYVGELIDDTECVNGTCPVR